MQHEYIIHMKMVNSIQAHLIETVTNYFQPNPIHYAIYQLPHLRIQLIHHNMNCFMSARIASVCDCNVIYVYNSHSAIVQHCLSYEHTAGVENGPPVSPVPFGGVRL